MKSVEKPTALLDEHLIYLDELRASGETNMYGARPYLQAEYPDLDDKTSGKILVYWMQTFAERHGLETRTP